MLSQLGSQLTEIGTIRWVLVALLSPIVFIYRLLSVLYRLIVCLFYKKGNYEKSKEISFPADSAFHPDEWCSFQYFEMKYRNLPDWKTIKRRFNEWSREVFNQDANIVLSDKTSNEYVKQLMRSKPSSKIKTSHLIVYCPSNNTIVCFFDHYYCDGVTFKSVILHVFDYESTAFSPIPKYRYIPLLGDSMAIELIGRQLFDTIQYPSQLSGIADHTRVLTTTFDTSTFERKWDRWCTFSRCILQLFDSLADIRYLRVGVTVAFETDQMFANNRIGVIICLIHRPSDDKTYDEQFDDIAEQFRCQCCGKYKDAHTSYDILRNLSSVALRDYGRDTIDVVFSCGFLKEKESPLVRYTGGFVGKQPKHKFLYVSVFTIGDRSFVTYVSNLKQMDYRLLRRQDVVVSHIFPNFPPTSD